MDDPLGTGERMVRVRTAALELAAVVEDLVRDIETITANLPDRTKRTHEIDLARRARQLAHAVRTAVEDTRYPGGLERRRRARRRVDEPQPAVEPPASPDRRLDGERRRHDRRLQEWA